MTKLIILQAVGIAGKHYKASEKPQEVPSKHVNYLLNRGIAQDPKAAKAAEAEAEAKK